MKVVSRLEAVAERRKYYYTGNPCSNGHVARRYTSNGRCVECAKVDGEKARGYKKKFSDVRKKRRSLIIHMSKDQLAIARALDRTCFEHPDLYGATQRQVQAMEKAGKVLELLDELGYKKQEDSMNDVAQMVDGFGLI